MGRMFTAQFTGVNIAAAQDLFSIASPTRGHAILHAVFIGQTTREGDSAEEILAWYIKSGATTVGSGGSDPANVPTQFGDVATGDARANDTTEASAGTIVTHHSDVFNNRIGLVYIPTPEMRFEWGELAAGTTTYLEVGLLTVPSAALTDSHGTVYWEEVG